MTPRDLLPCIILAVLLAPAAEPLAGADAPANPPTPSAPSASAAAVAGAGAASEAASAPPTRELHFQLGTVTVGSNLATIKLPPDAKYLQASDARYVLEALWHNEPDPNVLGLINMPLPSSVAGGDDDEGGVSAVVSYESEIGHVKDDDAAGTNYDELLKDMQKQSSEAMPERKKQGYITYQLLGWAEPPHYDHSQHMLFWAENLKMEDDPAPQMNYKIRLLGARGVLEINYLQPTSHLTMVRAMAKALIPNVAYSKGNGYDDFKPGYDKVAAYGIAGLIAGGVLLKTGFFGLLLKLILPFIKLIIVGVVVMFSFIGRLLGFKKRFLARIWA